MGTHPKPHAWTLIAVALLICGAVTLQTVRFHDRPYRQDEINTVHASQVLSLPEVAQWMARAGVHPAGWRMLAAGWIKIVGIDESATRTLSMLGTMIALALVFRLALDLFDLPTSFYALMILGTLPFAMFYLRELRPYSLLVMITAGLHLTFLRWVRAPRFKYAWLYVALGIAGLQTHYYAGYVLAAQALAFLVLVRWERGRYLRAFGLFCAIGLSFTPWLLPLIQRVFLHTNELRYTLTSDQDTLQTLNDQMQIIPRGLGHFLILTGVLLPTRLARTGEVVFRPSLAWRKPYLLLTPAFMLVIAWIANTKVNNLTARNLIIIVPTLVIVAGLALRRLPWQASGVIVALITLSSVRSWPFYQGTVPYREAVAFIQPHYEPGDRFITEQIGAVTLYYALLDRIPGISKYDFFNIQPDELPSPPDPYVNTAFQSDEASVQRMAAVIGTAERLWYLRQRRGSDLAPPFVAWVHQHYALYRRIQLSRPSITEYRRLPADLQDRYHIGADGVHLVGWTLPAGTTVEACQPVEVETWWQAFAAPPADYEIALVLTGEDGQPVAQIDAPPSYAPTSQWAAGYYLDVRTLEIPCDLPAGEYDLRVMLRDSAAPAAPAAEPASLTLLRVGE